MAYLDDDDADDEDDEELGACNTNFGASNDCSDSVVEVPLPRKLLLIVVVVVVVATSSFPSL